jgi:hypothetical protein
MRSRRSRIGVDCSSELSCGDGESWVEFWFWGGACSCGKLACDPGIAALSLAFAVAASIVIVAATTSHREGFIMVHPVRRMRLVAAFDANFTSSSCHG